MSTVGVGVTTGDTRLTIADENCTAGVGPTDEASAAKIAVAAVII